MRYEKYEKEELSKKLVFYKGLSEKRCRHFLATEYARLGIGSQRYLSEVFSCGRKTITKGSKELRESAGKVVDYSCQRKVGGGAKKKKR